MDAFIIFKELLLNTRIQTLIWDLFLNKSQLEKRKTIVAWLVMFIYHYDRIYLSRFEFLTKYKYAYIIFCEKKSPMEKNLSI